MNVLITGATSGIGLALSEYYLNQAGVDTLIAIGRNQDKLNELEGKGAYVLSCDLEDKAAVLALAESIGDKVKSLDLVILNAGGCHYYEPEQIDTLSDLVEKGIQQNFLSMVYCSELILPFLHAASNQPKLVLMGSLASDFPFTKAQGYGASKAAVRYLALSLAVDYPDVQVQLVQPGFVKTPLTDKNQFDMPAIVTPDKAVKAIFSGISNNKAVIRFPGGFACMLKTLACLPTRIQIALSRKMKS